MTEPLGTLHTGALPLWVKLAHTAFVAVLVPVYWRRYGPRNFLWLCDTALLASVPALWLEHRRLASMQALAVLVPDVLWTLDFTLGLAAGRPVTRFTRYMFDARLPQRVRALSLFHVWLPAVLVWIVAVHGYDERALVWQLVAGSVSLVVTFVATSPAENINYVFGLSPGPRRDVRTLALALVLYPVMFYLPAHLVLNRLF
ncbi:MAG TPA: hypothetical protein VNI83_00635 [Vicinamibacterales bacterium]|nr:hypothetical protein [Vicinamibacterales bacterium]